jgi:hypothetical protein
MKVVVLDKRVRQNLVLFRHLIHRNAEKMSRFFKKAKKTYNAFVNCQTGEMRFSETEMTKGKDWAPIVIQLRPNAEGGAFEVITPEGEESFVCERFSKEAYALFTKTIHILNQIAFDPKHRKNPFFILRQIAHVDFVLSEEEEGQRNLIHEAWHNVNRVEAEQLLKREKPGTYLFRKDEFAQELEDRFNEESEDPITCITLTWWDLKGRVIDKTLIYRDGNWQFYHDDIWLGGQTFGTVKELLASMSNRLSDPLLAH